MVYLCFCSDLICLDYHPHTHTHTHMYAQQQTPAAQPAQPAAPPTAPQIIQTNMTPSPEVKQLEQELKMIKERLQQTESQLVEERNIRNRLSQQVSDVLCVQTNKHTHTHTHIYTHTHTHTYACSKCMQGF